MKNILYDPNKQFCLILFFCLSLFLGACNAKSEEFGKEISTETEAVAEPATAVDNTVSIAPDIFPAAKIIRKATVKMQVDNFRESLAAIENTLPAHQAFVASSNETHHENKLENTLTIRVPAANLDLLLTKIIEHSVYLDFKNISSEDVSTEFVDITARIKSKKVVEDRYITFLKDAKNVTEILELESERRKIREEIEATQARINYINSQTAYSTIILEVYQPTAVITPTGNSYWIRMVNALGGGWEMLLSLIIGLLYIWPLLLLTPVFVYFSRRFMQKYPTVK